MQQIIFALPLMLCAAAACSPATHAAPPTSPAPPGASTGASPHRGADESTLDYSPVRISYRLSRGSEPGAIVLQGETALEAGKPVTVERRAPQSSELAALTMRSRPLNDGSLLIAMEYEEEGNEAGKIRWSPMLVVRRGAEVTTQVGFAGGEGRSLQLSVR